MILFLSIMLDLAKNKLIYKYVKKKINKFINKKTPRYESWGQSKFFLLRNL